ncbi:MAG: hypothetical protein SGJ27_05510 [Candidatus Melainabacteria bacterium]|nr:hypothetical protein [Candidatus Melainabacteria bacterium]
MNYSYPYWVGIFKFNGGEPKMLLIYSELIRAGLKKLPAMPAAKKA